MNPDHRQSNYWVPPQDEPVAELPVQPEAETFQPEQPQEPYQQAEQLPDEAQDSETQVDDEPEAQQDVTEDVVPDDESDVVHWKALEHIPHERDALWFVIFAVVVVALIAVAIFFMKSWSFTTVIVVAAASLLVYVRRPPRELSYTLTRQGLYVGDKLYDLSGYKAFGVISIGVHHSVMLIPHKRFMPGMTVFFPHESGEEIVDHLAARLPMKDLQVDLFDKIILKLRL